MAGPDATQNFLNNLPEIRAGETFWFACHPAVPCFNACCADLNMPLMPYDVLRLCHGLGMSSEEFFENFAIAGCYEDTGFPLLHLRMLEAPDRLCPFVTDKGCGVYAHRSSACRTYPLGRAARPATENELAAGLDREGIIEQYFLVREEHCEGFAENRDWTLFSWLADQEIAVYNDMNDRYLRLIMRYKKRANGALLSGKHATMALMCLYQQDRFLEFASSVNLFSRVRFKGEYAAMPPDKIAGDFADDAKKRLCFAFDWVELALLGSSPNLEPGA